MNLIMVSSAKSYIVFESTKILVHGVTPKTRVGLSEILMCQNCSFILYININHVGSRRIFSFSKTIGLNGYPTRKFDSLFNSSMNKIILVSFMRNAKNNLQFSNKKCFES